MNGDASLMSPSPKTDKQVQLINYYTGESLGGSTRMSNESENTGKNGNVSLSEYIMYQREEEHAKRLKAKGKTWLADPRPENFDSEEE